MTNPLVLRLGHAVDLSPEDLNDLQRITSRPRKVGPRTVLIQEGEKPEVVRLVMSGLACRYQTLPDGGRQIVALLLPGDFCDLHVTILGEMDHSIATLSACDIVEIPRATIKRLTDSNPRITHALWWATLVDEAVLRHWLASKGRRKADQQLLHLFLELLVRFQSVELAEGDSFPFPVTQEELGDILGISSVHTSRILHELRARGLASVQSGRVTLLDQKRGRELVDFNPNYLHLMRRA
jgi:CRP-like cAMP-binding protein